MIRFRLAAIFFLSTHSLQAAQCWNLAEDLLAKPRANYKVLRDLLEPELPNLSPQAQRAFELYDGQLRDRLGSLIPENLVLYVIADEEKLVYSQQLAQIFESLALQPGSKVSQTKLEKIIRQQLEDLVPKSTINTRIDDFFARPSLKSLQRVLGKMDLEEVGLLVHGGNPLHPSKDSLIGKYINDTGAKTVVRDFPTRPMRATVDDSGRPPDLNSKHGPKRLVVAISERSLAVYKKLFSRHNFLVHVHTPDQGTLVVAHNGMAGTFARANNEMRLNEPGTLMPHILLNSDEGQRTTQYFRLGLANSQVAKEPWALRAYCAEGGYNSCTHWIGNIPIGDRQVAEYSFPGAIDEHASNSLYRGAKDKEPRIRRLRKYNSTGLQYDMSVVSDFDGLVHRVWAVPGNEQLADVLGIRRQNLNGELANPGFVALSLLGRVDQERIPIVFYVVRNHREEIPRNFELQISAY
jgi:hypothetical protein